jgi:GMP synthase PP-ATPase subunit
MGLVAAGARTNVGLRAVTSTDGMTAGFYALA